MENPENGKETVKTIAEALGVPPLFARILIARGIETPAAAETFLYPKLEALSDPFLLPDIDKAVQRTIHAILAGEQLCFFGDYDADGVTSTALVVHFFRHLGIEAHAYIPKREEGYGLNTGAVEALAAEGVTLIISLDCGSTNFREVNRANELGVDVVIVDHHETAETLPEAHAVVNPKRKDSRFPTRELAACGVTFFFLLALRREMHHRGLLKKPINLKRELDLVALGTMGDMVPLTGDNRILVKFGLDMMRNKPRTWLKSFYKQNILRKSSINEYVLNFVIIPRINATGRVSSAKKSLDFLTCDDHDHSERYLESLHNENRERQRIEEEILRQTVEMVGREGLNEGNAIVLFKEDWHIGVIGIVAQRLVEMYKKPSIVFTEVGGICKGSGRGVDGVDLHETIKSLSSMLVRFGGHKYACGISLEKDNFYPFRDAMQGAVQILCEMEKKGTHVDADGEFGDLTGDLLEWIDQLAPFGIGNPRPHILLPPARITSLNRLLKITDEKNRTWYGSPFGKIQIPKTVNARSIVSPVLREERGERFVHLQVRDFIPV